VVAQVADRHFSHDSECITRETRAPALPRRSGLPTISMPWTGSRRQWTRLPISRMARPLRDEMYGAIVPGASNFAFGVTRVCTRQQACSWSGPTGRAFGGRACEARGRLGARDWSEISASVDSFPTLQLLGWAVQAHVSQRRQLGTREIVPPNLRIRVAPRVAETPPLMHQHLNSFGIFGVRGRLAPFYT
jgi:hypothetical protein